MTQRSLPDRCHGCKLPHEFCLCNDLPRIDLPLRFIIIQHVGEEHSQSNTGRLVHRIFRNSELYDYRSMMRSAHSHSALWTPNTSCAVLFPQPGARPVSPEAIASAPGTPPSLILLDGKWRQARRMSRRIPGLRKLPFVAIPAQETPREGVRQPLRRPRRPGQLSTAEAAYRALAALGYTNAALQLKESFELLVSRVLHVRGKISRRRLEAESQHPNRFYQDPEGPAEAVERESWRNVTG